MKRAMCRWLTALVAISVATVAAAWPATGAWAAGTRTAVAAGAGARAMWVWSRADPGPVIAWSTSHAVKEIFVYVAPGPLSSNDLGRLRRLKAQADAAGIRLAALGADARWLSDPASAVMWLRTVQATGLFSRCHVDVEPYTLPAWTTDRTRTISSFLGLLEALHAESRVPLEVDVPFWYSTVPVGTGNVADAVLARVDAVTVMTYRDTASGPNSMLDVATDMLVRGTAANKPVRLAVETQALPECVYCTFFEEGQRRMTTVMASVDAVAAKYPVYAGIAVHHYDSWRKLAP